MDFKRTWNGIAQAANLINRFPAALIKEAQFAASTESGLRLLADRDGNTVARREAPNQAVILGSAGTEGLSITSQL
jgi:hypothetical protein